MALAILSEIEEKNLFFRKVQSLKNTKTRMWRYKKDAKHSFRLRTEGARERPELGRGIKGKLNSPLTLRTNAPTI